VIQPLGADLVRRTMQRAATMRRLNSVATAIVAQVGTRSDGSAQLKLNTSHPANQRFALGRARRLRVLTEEQLALFWENGCACIAVP
jgi:hypothetical protein